MKTKALTLLTLLATVVGIRISHASLNWQQTEIELHPAAGEPTAVGKFQYKNTGDGVIHFKSVTTSCGCTTAARKKDEVAPGESGEITATFKIGGNTGVQQKTVRVETDDPNSPVTVLTLRAVIPQMLELRPTFVYWESSEPPKPKTISVKVAKELHTTSLKVSSSNADFTTAVTAVRPNEFKIDVQPRDTSHPVSATLMVQPDSGGKPVFATARVINPSISAQ